MAKIQCDKCKKHYDLANHAVTAGAAAAGAGVGSGMGIVMGPLGGIAGTVPGAVIGGALAGLGVTKFAKCPHSGHITMV